MGLKPSALVAVSAMLVAAAATALVVGSASAAPTPSVLALTASGGATPAVAINESTTKALTVKNSTTGTVSFTVAVSNTTGSAWSLGTTTCTGSLLAGRSCSVGTVFAPTMAGAATADLVLTDGSGGVASSPLASTGLKHFTLTPPSGDYGLWAQGSTSPAKTYTVTNNHQTAITVSSITTTNPDFIRTGGTCTSTIAAKASCTVNIAFAPRSAGLDFSTGQLAVAVAGMGTQSADLSGRKVVAILVTPSPVDFGKVGIGAQVDKVVTVSNRATFPISLGLPSLSALGNYSIPSTTCTATVAATSTCTITVRLAPTSLGAKATRLLVPYDEGAGTVVAADNVNGIGVTVPGAPTGVHANPGDAAAVVSWTAPGADGGTPITGYKIIARANGVDGPPATVDASTTSTNITGLTNGTPYTFTVTATNAVGAGIASAPSAATTPIKPGPDCSAFPNAPQNTDLHGCDFSGRTVDNTSSSPLVDLSGDNFSGANFSNAHLTLVPMTGANFTGVNLGGANLDRSTLTGANLTGANLTGANLTGIRSGNIVGTPAALPTGWTLFNGYLIGPGAWLQHAELSGAQLAGANLANTDLTGANLFGAYLPNTDLSGANLSGATLLLAQLDHANLTGANLSGATLQAAELTGADLTGADLTGIHSGHILIDGAPAVLPDGWTLLSGYLVGPGAWLQHANLAGAPLFGANLSNADLTSANLSNAVLATVSLAGANLTGANLAGANLTGVRSGNIVGTPAALPDGWTLANGYLVGPGAELEDADLSGAQLAGANLTYARLSNANLFGAFLHNADLTGANLGGATLVLANLDGANLTTADLTGATLQQADLTGSDLTDAVLTGIHSGHIAGTPAVLPGGWTLVKGYLIGVHAGLQNADLSGAQLQGAELGFSDLTGADLSGADLTGADLTGVRSGNIVGIPAAMPTGWTLFNGYLVGYGAQLQNADLTGAQLAGVSLAGADLRGATLVGTFLPNANLSGANLSGATLILANLANANLGNANLTGANLRQADVTGADFTHATLDGIESGLGYGPPAALPIGWTWDYANGAFRPPV